MGAKRPPSKVLEMSQYVEAPDAMLPRMSLISAAVVQAAARAIAAADRKTEAPEPCRMKRRSTLGQKVEHTETRYNFESVGVRASIEDAVEARNCGFPRVATLCLPNNVTKWV